MINKEENKKLIKIWIVAITVILVTTTLAILLEPVMKILISVISIIVLAIGISFAYRLIKHVITSFQIRK